MYFAFLRANTRRILSYFARSLTGSWVEEVRDNVQDKWPYLSLLPEQRTGEPCIAVGGVNTVVPIVVRVPQTSEGPDGNPEVALGYDVRDRLNNTMAMFCGNANHQSSDSA